MAIAHVQSAQGDSTDHVAFASNNTAGNLIVVAVLFSPSTALVTGITDTRGNTYVQARSHTNSTGNIYGTVWYAKNVAAGANTVTLSFSGVSSSQMIILEYSGLDTTAPLDQVNSATSSSAGTVLNSGNVTTTAANELIFGAAGVASAANITPGAGFTERQDCNNKLEAMDQVVSATGTYAASWTDDVSGHWVALVVTFSAGGALAPITPTVGAAALGFISPARVLGTILTPATP